MHSYDLIFTLTGGLGAALVFGYVTHRLGLSPIVGYLLAGTLIGPHTPGFVADGALAEQMAEIGVILLMFGVGLQFHLEDLMAVRRVAVPGALTASSIATGLGLALALALGWEWSSALMFGMALAIASTVVLVRVLSDNNELHTPAGHVAVGWLVVEDVMVIIALVLLPVFLGPEVSDSSVGVTVLITGLKIVGLVVFVATVGTRVIPRVLDYVAHTRSRELFTLTVLVIALGIAVGSALVFNVSMALGAFLAGMVVGRSEYSLRAASDALPMRDAFAVLFFVSIGMLLNPEELVETPMLVAGALAIVLVAKPLIALLVVWAFRYPFTSAIQVGASLAHIGEFSFILSTLGRDLGLLGDAATNAIIAVSMIAILVNPVIVRTLHPITRWLSARPKLWRLANRPVHLPAEPLAHRDPATLAPGTHRAVLIGYGPTGRTVVRLLRESGIEPTVIELNMETVRALRQSGVDALYGDAMHPDTLTKAEVQTAGSLILTSAGMSHSTEVIRAARELNPDIRVLARAAYLRDLPALRRAGADTVFTGEGEVALAFVEEILERLGARPEQIDRERARVREELFGKT